MWFVSTPWNTCDIPWPWPKSPTHWLRLSSPLWAAVVIRRPWHRCRQRPPAEPSGSWKFHGSVHARHCDPGAQDVGQVLVIDRLIYVCTCYRCYSTYVFIYLSVYWFYLILCIYICRCVYPSLAHLCAYLSGISYSTHHTCWVSRTASRTNLFKCSLSGFPVFYSSSRICWYVLVPVFLPTYLPTSTSIYLPCSCNHVESLSASAHIHVFTRALLCLLLNHIHLPLTACIPHQ